MGMHAYQEAVDLQVQAQQEVEVQASQMQAEISLAHAAAAKAVGAHEATLGRVPSKLPRRQGMPHCQFYMRTGECAYGFSCKWDHPDREGPQLNAKGLPIRPGEADCTYFMKTGTCKFGPTCRWNHPESRLGGMQAPPVVVPGTGLTV